MAKPGMRIQPSLKQKTTIKTKLAWISGGIVTLACAAFFLVSPLGVEKSENQVSEEAMTLSENELEEVSVLSELTELSTFSIENEAAEEDFEVSEESFVAEEKKEVKKSVASTVRQKAAKVFKAKAAATSTANAASTTSTANAASSSASSVKYQQVATKLTGTSGEVNWTTAFQVNSKKFEIERSYNGSDFSKLGEVKGDGTLSKEKTYSYLDNTLIEAQMPRVYYRVGQVGIDGKVTYSEPVEHRLHLDLGLYTKVIKDEPGKVKVQYASDEDHPVKLRVMDVAGQTMEEHELKSSLHPKILDLETEKLKKGQYYLQLYTATSSAMEMFEVQ